MNQNNDAWRQCPNGVIGSVSNEMSARKRAAERRQFLKVASGAAVVIGGVGFTGWSLMGSGSPTATNPSSSMASMKYGGVTCAEVITELAGYVSESLDQKKTEAFKVHLSMCPSCKMKYDRMVAKTA